MRSLFAYQRFEEGFRIGMTINYALAYKLGRPFVSKRMTAEHLEQITRLWSK